MPELFFSIGEVKAMPHAAVPAVVAPLRIANGIADEKIQSISLNCLLQIQPRGRPYTSAEEARLLDLFGERHSWGTTMNPLHWMNLVLKVPPFSGSTVVDLPLPCSLDFDVAANKYFYGLDAGSIAAVSMFSGTVFYADQSAPIRIWQIPWEREARFRLPVEVWKQAIDAHYPDSAWLRLPRETFDRLYRYRVSRGIPNWQQALNQLLEGSEPQRIAEITSDGMAIDPLIGAKGAQP